MIRKNLTGVMISLRIPMLGLILAMRLSFWTVFDMITA